MLYPYLSIPMPRPAEGFYTWQVEQPGPLPVRTFLPTGYEPRYAYPLVVFFHGHGGNDEQIIRLAPRLSRRNFICISIRGSQVIDMHPDGRLGYSWGADEGLDVLLEEYVMQAVDMTAERYNIHRRRIYLAGVCQGATLAYRLGLTFPDKFAGVISLNGAMPRYRRPLLRLPDIRHMHLFIGHGIANAVVPMSLAKADSHLLYTAGLNVDFHSYPTTHKLHPDMLRDINRWIISHCDRTCIAS
jgi:phospholipase/carboxylesterase